ncbi:hypothetical protein CgunFtcFv8_011274 [Champsocephalus gunnari]|uniref:Uncharacterized protein n=1 Tax=Champsocephalus gunnari TaxID=52237 RepID=A0AAN8DEI3_CHAGU|nr:hypothetical protein CgunFtcFv8_011274 [Champsocephalus gunnari]
MSCSDAEGNVLVSGSAVHFPTPGASDRRRNVILRTREAVWRGALVLLSVMIGCRGLGAAGSRSHLRLLH